MVDSPSIRSLNPLISIQTLAISEVDWYTKRRYDAPHRYYSDGEDDEDGGAGGVDPAFFVPEIGGAAPAPPPDPPSAARPPSMNSANPSRSSAPPPPAPRRSSATNSAPIPPSGCAIKLHVAIKQPNHHPNPPRHHRPTHTAPAAATNRRKPRRESSLREPTSPEITCLGKVRIRRRKCPGQGLDHRDVAGKDGLIDGKAPISGAPPMMMMRRGRNEPAAADDRLSTKMDICIVRGGLLRGNCTNQVADQHGLEGTNDKKVSQSLENRKIVGSRERWKNSGADKWIDGGNQAPIKDKMGDEAAIKGASRDKISVSESIIKAMEASSERRRRRRKAVVSNDDNEVSNRSAVDVSAIDLSRFGSRAGNRTEVLPETLAAWSGISGGSGRRAEAEKGGEEAAPPKNSLLLMRGRGSKAAEGGGGGREYSPKKGRGQGSSSEEEAADEEKERREIRTAYESRLWERRNVAEPTSIGIIRKRTTTKNPESIPP